MVDEAQRLVESRLEQSRLEGQLRVRNAALQQDAAKPQAYYRGYDCKSGQIVAETPGGNTHRAGQLISNGMVQDGTPLKQIRGGIPSLVQRPAAAISPLAGSSQSESFPRLKILFAVNKEGNTWEFFVGGDRQTPTLIHTGTYSTRPSTAQNALVSTGKGRNSWRFTTEDSTNFIWKSGNGSQVLQPKSLVQEEFFDQNSSKSPSLFHGTTIRHGVFPRDKGFVFEGGPAFPTEFYEEWWNIVSWLLDASIFIFDTAQHRYTFTRSDIQNATSVGQANYSFLPQTDLSKEVVVWSYQFDRTIQTSQEDTLKESIINAMVSIDMTNVLYQARTTVTTVTVVGGNGTNTTTTTDRYYLGQEEIPKENYDQLTGATELKKDNFHFIPNINPSTTDPQKIIVDIRSFDGESIAHNPVTVEVLPLFKKNQIPTNYVVLSRSLSL